MRQAKGGPGAALVALRWEKTTEEQRREVSKRMHEAKAKRKAKKGKKG